ncbi:MAG: hypothetical protein KH218_22295, partial [Klebsiella sp.]|nr:hypothetical protein [Klebsiella sp.]
ELLLCHGTVCVVGKIRDLILQLSKSSIYSTKPYQPVIPDLKADFNLTVNPSPEFGIMVEAVADKRIEWAFDDQNFQINQSILGQ